MVTALTFPVAMVCFPLAPFFLVFNVLIRVIVTIVFCLGAPVMCIPGCCCIYPFIYLMVVFRDMELPDDVMKLTEEYSKYDGDFASLLTDLEDIKNEYSDMSIFFPPSSEQQQSKPDIQAKASCSISLETSNTDELFSMDEKDSEQKVSSAFKDSLDDIILSSISAEDSLSSKTHVTSHFNNPTKEKEENENESSALATFDVYFTVTKQFSCNGDDEGKDEENGECDRAFAMAQGFIQDTKSSLKDGFDSGSFSTALTKNGFDKNASIGNMECDSIDAKFIYD